MKIKIEDTDYESILDALSDERVLTLSKAGEAFELTEACDSYFTVTLTKEQLIALADEIRAKAG